MRKLNDGSLVSSKKSNNVAIVSNEVLNIAKSLSKVKLLGDVENESAPLGGVDNSVEDVQQLPDKEDVVANISEEIIAQ
jgi:hypothetical protein